MNNDKNNEESFKLAIASKFQIDGKPTAVTSFGSGHINDTYKISTDKSEAGYLLQRINHHVFKNIDQVMSNIALVSDHLHKKRVEAQIEDTNTVLTLVATKAGSLYLKDDHGDYWRVYHLIADAISYDLVENDEQAREVGRAFGDFQNLLSDLDASQIHEVIPNFCHIGSRLSSFHKALEKDVVDRSSIAKEEIDFIIEREGSMNTVLDMASRNELPIRITHNDTKFNNVLLDRNNKAKCVIDLDTVMPGYVAYDYGDAIRTIINKAAEDEADLTKVTLNLSLFKAYTEGYFEKAKSFLTENEVKSLLPGALLFPYMQAVRFLTDYLEGDQYYKTRHKEHNLQRTRAQLKLVKEMEKHHHEMSSIIDKIAKKYTILKE